MNIRKKYWIIIAVLLIPHFAYALTVFDSLLEYFLGKPYLIFSYPNFLIFQSIDYLFGNPEGFGLAILIGNVIYPLYSFFIFIISIILAKKVRRIEKKGYAKFIIISVIVLILPLIVAPINSSLSYASYKKENRELLESHNNLAVNVFKANFELNEIIILMTIEGLEPNNKNYLIEIMLRDKNKGNLGSVTFEASYVDYEWKYDSMLGGIEQTNDIVLVRFSIDSNRYDKENLDILVDIHRDFNLFYSERFDVVAN